MRKTIYILCRGVAVAAALVLSACMGPAESDGQRAYQALGHYVYLAIPVAEYAAEPAANAGSLAALRQLDRRAYGSARAAVAELRAGGGVAGAAIKIAQQNLETFNLAIFGQLEVPGSALEAGQRGLVLALVGARGAQDAGLAQGQPQAGAGRHGRGG